MIKRGYKLVEEFKSCFKDNVLKDKLRASEILIKLKDLPVSLEDSERLLEEVENFLEGKKFTSIPVRIKEYTDAFEVVFSERINNRMLEDALEKVRVNYIERFNELMVNPTENLFILTYKGLKDIIFDFDYDITEEEFYKFGLFLNDLLS